MATTQFYITKQVNASSQQFKQGLYTTPMERNDVLPEGSIHLPTKISRELANNRKDNSSKEKANVHGTYMDVNDVNIEPNEIVICRREDKKARGFTSTTGDVIPDTIKTQWQFERMYQYLGISLMGFRFNDASMPGDILARTLRGLITIWNTSRIPISIGDAIRICLKPLDRQERNKIKGQPMLPDPITINKNNVVTEPARYDELHQFELQVFDMLARGKSNKPTIVKKSEEDGMFDDCAKATKDFVMHSVLAGLAVFQAMGAISFTPGFETNSMNNDNIDDTFTNLHNSHALRGQMLNINKCANMFGLYKNQQQPMDMPIVQENILKTLFDTTNPRIARKIAESDEPSMRRHFQNMQKSQVNSIMNMYCTMQEGMKDYQNSIIGVAYQNAYGGDRFDICV